MAEEATTDHILPAFFEKHSIEDLRLHTDCWLGHQGRLIHPVVRRRNATQYEPIMQYHVVPRTKGDGLRGFFWPRTTYADDADRDDWTARLRAALPPSRVTRPDEWPSSHR